MRDEELRKNTQPQSALEITVERESAKSRFSRLKETAIEYYNRLPDDTKVFLQRVLSPSEIGSNLTATTHALIYATMGAELILNVGEMAYSWYVGQPAIPQWHFREDVMAAIGAVFGQGSHRNMSQRVVHAAKFGVVAQLVYSAITGSWPTNYEGAKRVVFDTIVLSGGAAGGKLFIHDKLAPGADSYMHGIIIGIKDYSAAKRMCDQIHDYRLQHVFHAGESRNDIELEKDGTYSIRFAYKGPYDKLVRLKEILPKDLQMYGECQVKIGEIVYIGRKGDNKSSSHSMSRSNTSYISEFREKLRRRRDLRVLDRVA